MKIIKEIQVIQQELNHYRNDNQSIGFVPTMGALHSGHLRLVERCIAENEVCVVSIFVNPTQFNNTKDLQTYPRDLQADCSLLEKIGCQIVFAPETEEMYPEPDSRQFNFGSLESVMEGQFRPGHFNGVAQIVSKLFQVIQPKKAYFGEKDFQQLAIIRNMTTILNLSVDIVPCSIVRENDGLAMSSRNTRLNPEQRQKAVTISQSLIESCNLCPTVSVKEVKNKVIQSIDQVDGLSTEYFEIVNGDTLQAIVDWTDAEFIVGCIAVFCGEVRLIDNITYKTKRL